MPLQYDYQIWIIGRFKTPGGGERTDWDSSRYERLIALLLDRIFSNPIGRLLREQIVQRIWIIPYTSNWGWPGDRNATASDAGWIPMGSMIDYLQHRVCETFTPVLGDQLMSRAGCQLPPSARPLGYHYPRPNPIPSGPDGLVSFTPADWGPSSSCRRCADPSERRDEVLFHELFHVIRQLLKTHRRFIDLTPEDYLNRTKMDNFEEFCAILVTNYYIMAAGVGRLRRNHHGFKTIRWTDYWTYRWRHAIEKFCEQQEKFARSLIPYAQPEYDYDPIGEYFAKKDKKSRKSSTTKWT